jgi:hypothetical protein
LTLNQLNSHEFFFLTMTDTNTDTNISKSTTNNKKYWRSRLVSGIIGRPPRGRDTSTMATFASALSAYQPPFSEWAAFARACATGGVLTTYPVELATADLLIVCEGDSDRVIIAALAERILAAAGSNRSIKIPTAARPCKDGRRALGAPTHTIVRRGSNTLQERRPTAARGPDGTSSTAE